MNTFEILSSTTGEHITDIDAEHFDFYFSKSEEDKRIIVFYASKENDHTNGSFSYSDPVAMMNFKDIIVKRKK